MRCAGIDIGSRSMEVVVLEEGNVVAFRQGETGYAPLEQAESLLRGLSWDRLMATGYGRSLAAQAFSCPAVTEIKAYARGARELSPFATTVLDIGGQDCKVISLRENGKVKKFEMNDRCAAGTGKFLEIMAATLGFDIREFGERALEGKDILKINSMCTVFAESEVVSLISRGENPGDIARALHTSVVLRALSMLRRIGFSGELFFAGGVARNRCMKHLLEAHLQEEVVVPEYPQRVGAYGAALLAGE
ncbi:MAG TPA: acyl-CoA dehydratase activase [Synergistaceae bacterium]|nr:acyl-CoA dehydratase activase [Synergistaceae bacterium]HPJ25023.1 acyl-CoA dehydratase activase [Synergistaceae bacterium]HPQ36691.1 acyl-CoA dehydratase activase [Synergistaceae bacterium]